MILASFFFFFWTILSLMTIFNFSPTDFMSDFIEQTCSNNNPLTHKKSEFPGTFGRSWIVYFQFRIDYCMFSFSAFSTEKSNFFSVFLRVKWRQSFLRANEKTFNVPFIWVSKSDRLDTPLCYLNFSEL